jgi:hypothetical protein
MLGLDEAIRAYASNIGGSCRCQTVDAMIIKIICASHCLVEPSQSYLATELGLRGRRLAHQARQAATAVV